MQDAEDAAELRRWARSLVILADRWADSPSDAGPTGARVDARVAVMGCVDLNDLSALSATGVLFMEGEGAPLELEELRALLVDRSEALAASAADPAGRVPLAGSLVATAAALVAATPLTPAEVRRAPTRESAELRSIAWLMTRAASLLADGAEARGPGSPGPDRVEGPGPAPRDEPGATALLLAASAASDARVLEVVAAIDLGTTTTARAGSGFDELGRAAVPLHRIDAWVSEGLATALLEQAWGHLGAARQALDPERRPDALEHGRAAIQLVAEATFVRAAGERSRARLRAGDGFADVGPVASERGADARIY